MIIKFDVRIDNNSEVTSAVSLSSYEIENYLYKKKKKINLIKI
ncbi:hypothetical protein RW115_06480 [Macrococcus capreoli]